MLINNMSSILSILSLEAIFVLIKFLLETSNCPHMCIYVLCIYTQAQIFQAHLFQVMTYIEEILCIQISLINSSVNLPHIMNFYIEFFAYIDFFNNKN